MKSLIRLLINFIVSGVVILIFKYLEWIDFTNPPEIVSDESLNNLIIGGFIGIFIFIIGELAEVLYKIIIAGTCGLACLFYPIFGFALGYIKLFGTQFVLQDWFSFDTTWWKVLIISIAIGLIRIPSVKVKKKLTGSKN